MSTRLYIEKKDLGTIRAALTDFARRRRTDWVFARGNEKRAAGIDAVRANALLAKLDEVEA